MASAPQNIDAVARDFVSFYYKLLADNRPGLAALYQAHSMLTFEGTQLQGPEAILGRLSGLPAFQGAPSVDTLDAQPSALVSPGVVSGAAMIIFVTGRLAIDGETNPQRFSQTFQLVSAGASFYVLNDIFRLNYG